MSTPGLHPFRPRLLDCLRGYDRAQLVAEGWPVAASLLLVVLYGRVGVFVLKALAGDADVANFNVAYMLSQPFGFLSHRLGVLAPSR